MVSRSETVHENVEQLAKDGRKICLVCTHGGHLTEMLQLIESLDGNDFFFITTESMRTNHLSHKKYHVRNIQRWNPLSFVSAAFRIADVLRREKPDLVISNGAGIAVPAIAMARLLGIQTVFVESLCRVVRLSPTGMALLPLSDVFLVQWEELVDRYPNRVEYWGRII
jgi:UDP-N-acetylglucosamine:LPS N-acetylglucosamine transferase